MTLFWIFLAVGVGFMLGAWWAARPRPIERCRRCERIVEVVDE